MQKLSTNNSIIVEGIAQELKVSPLTIRRDLDSLASKGLVERFHGGAKYVNRTLRSDPAIDYEDSILENKKRIIAKNAASLVEEGDTILINSSSTAYYMFEYLADMQITIITNNANALYSIDNSKFDLVFTGGEINTLKHSMVGTFPLQMLKKIRANKCFIGVSGINKDGNISTAVLRETTVNISMMNQTNESIVILADSTKIGLQHNFDIGSLDNATHIITDYDITDQQLEILKKHSAAIIIAENNL